jgi:hypothetical protein
MAFSNSGIPDSPFFSSSKMHSLEKIVDEFPDVVGEKQG